MRVAVVWRSETSDPFRERRTEEKAWLLFLPNSRPRFAMATMHVDVRLKLLAPAL